MSSWRVVPLVAVMLAVLGGEALACPICFTGRVVSIGQKLDAADAAVLAQASGPNGTYKIVKVIKNAGDLPANITDIVPRSDAPPPSSDAVLLLLRNRLSHSWVSVGAISTGSADWLRQIAALGAVGEPPVRLVRPPSSGDPDEEWTKR